MEEALTREDVLNILKQAGFPEFDLDEENRPIPGSVVKYFREQKTYPDPNNPDKLKHWTQADLGRLAGMTYVQVSNMENYNEGLDSIEKRRMLCALLKIPPALLGLASLYDLKNILIEKTNDKIDITNHIEPKNSVETYTSIFNVYNELYIQWSGRSSINDIEVWMKNLHEDILLTTSKNERKQFLYLLWEFHRLATKIYTDEFCNWNKAEYHLNKQLEIARELYDDVLLVATLDHSCTVSILQENFHLARLSIDAALSSLKNTPAIVQALILADGATAYVLNMRGWGDEKTARQYLEQSQVVLKQKDSKDARYIPSRIDTTKCLFSQVDAFNALGENRGAIHILEEIQNKMRETRARRIATLNLMKAQCYIDTKKPEYEQAILALTAAFNMYRSTGSIRNIDKMNKMYQKIARSSYGNAPEVVDLGMQLRVLRRTKS
jgi:transcriptional regulator with XRE-family HTH domain